MNKNTITIRYIGIDIETAKKLYEEGGFKKEFVLKVFKEEELVDSYKNIKTFDDAVKYLNIDYHDVICLYVNQSRQIISILKLNIIINALNGNWKPSLNTGDIYYCCPSWYLEEEENFLPKNSIILGKFKDLTTNKNYILTYTEQCSKYGDGLGNFNCGYGDINPTIGFVGCKSREIALHLAKYFGKLIFDASYSQYNNYKWIE